MRSRTRKLSIASVASSSTRMEGGLDLAERAGEATGDRHRRRRAASVPVPPGLPRSAGGAEVRSVRELRRAVADAAKADGQAPRARPVRARVGVCRGALLREPRLVPRRLRAIRAPDSHVRCDHPQKAPRDRPGGPSDVPFSRQASRSGPQHDRRSDSRGRGEGASEVSGRLEAHPVRPLRRAGAPDRRNAQRVPGRRSRPRISVPGAGRSRQRSPWRSTARPSPKRTNVAYSRPSCAGSERSSAIPRRSHVPPT